MQFDFSAVFAVGQRVRYLYDRTRGAIDRGEEGTIVGVFRDSKDLAIDWDLTGPGRHDCVDLARPHHGWYVSMVSVELI